MNSFMDRFKDDTNFNDFKLLVTSVLREILEIKQKEGEININETSELGKINLLIDDISK